MNVKKVHIDYLAPLISASDSAIELFKLAVVAADIEFDTLVGTGLSGTLSAPMFARAIGCNFAIVRKSGAGSHSCHEVEGIVGKRWVFVDDLICTGETRKRVKTAMANFNARYDWKATYVGDYLFFAGRFYPNGGV